MELKNECKRGGKEAAKRPYCNLLLSHMAEPTLAAFLRGEAAYRACCGDTAARGRHISRLSLSRVHPAVSSILHGHPLTEYPCVLSSTAP